MYEPDFYATVTAVARLTVVRLTAKQEHTALTFRESRALARARRTLTAG
jgi:hypothetical protein